MTTIETDRIVKHRRHNIGKELWKSLSIAANEKDVENAYRHAFSTVFPSSTTSANKTDGVLFTEVSTIFEFKYNLDLKKKLDQATVLIQVIWYLKKMEKKGLVLPKSVFIGDINECFCLPVSMLSPYLVRNGIDLSVGASSAAASFPEYVKSLVDDNSVSPFVFNITEKFDFAIIVERIKSLETGAGHIVPINRENIVEIFTYFKDHVVTEKRFREALVIEKDQIDRLTKLADIFFNCLTDKEQTYLHPKKKNCLVSRGENIAINTNLFVAFFSHFKQDYSPSELEELVANKDRILEEVYRRMTGAYFTPTIWVNEAHKMVSDVLGPNWRDEYVVWDCAAGTANLTRDYKFKELYVSTIEQGDIDTIGDMGYNKGAVIFKYDFLSEIGIDGVPESLRKAFAEGKKVLFLINPPYGAATSFSMKIGQSKDGISDTEVSNSMKQIENWSSQQLYVQFLFKILQLAKKYNSPVTIGVFTNPGFISGPSFEKFRKGLISVLQFQKGFLFQASNFAEVSDKWGISFTIWSPNNGN